MRYNCLINSLLGGVKSDCYTRGMMRIGFGDVPIVDGRRNRCMLQVNGTIHLSETTGPVCFGEGSKLSIGKDAIMRLGDNFKN